MVYFYELPPTLILATFSEITMTCDSSTGRFDLTEIPLTQVYSPPEIHMMRNFENKTTLNIHWNIITHCIYHNYTAGQLLPGQLL